MKILELLADKKVIVSFGQGRMYLNSGIVKVNGVVVKDQETEVKETDSVKVGKRDIGM